MYDVKIYAHEDLERVLHASDEQQALVLAYERIGTNGVRVAHIVRQGSTSGIFIARADDFSRATFPALIETLRNVKWGTL